MTTLSSAILDPLMASDPAGPRITYYDDATGERIELSTATLANWAAKTGNLLRDELGAGPSSRVAVMLPAHWQTAAVLFGIWWIGAEVVMTGQADIALCTVDRLADADDAVGMGEIAVLSLDPFGKPVPDLPVGVTDYATAVRVHGDQISPERVTRRRAGRALGRRCPRGRPNISRRTGFRRRRPGDVRGVLGRRRRADGQLAGRLRDRRVTCPGGESRPCRARPSQTDREGHPGLSTTGAGADRIDGLTY